MLVAVVASVMKTIPRKRKCQYLKTFRAVMVA